MLASAPADAQTIPGVTEGLPDIVVTAQRRVEPLARTPLSVTAISGNEIVEAGVQSVGDLAMLAPNISIDPAVTLSGSNAAAAIFIRGVGQSDFLLTTDPGVGLYVDGVYVSRSVGSLLDLIDIGRVEIVRGPQGTLYGKNTIGGAINVISRRPGKDPSLTADLTVGTDRLFNAILTANLPLSSRVRARVTAGRLSQDGYVRRPLVEDRLGNTDRVAFRGQLDIDLTDTLSLLLAADYMKADEAGGPSTLIRTYSLAGPPLNQSFIHNVVLGAPGGIYDGRWATGSAYVSNGTAPSISDLEVGGASATTTLDLGWAEAKSITAWRAFGTYFTRDGDQSPLNVYATTARVHDRQFTQEVQLSGHRGAGFDWLVGGFYGYEKGRDDSKLFLAGFDIQSGGHDIISKSWALFGQQTYRPFAKLGLTAGLRYTGEEKSYTPDQFFLASRLPAPRAGTILVPGIAARRSFSNVNYRLAADYAWNDALMTYASWSTGFKSGGFTQRNSSVVPALPTFDPERVKVAEIGFKYQAPDRRIRFNGAAFETYYTDLQILVVEQAGFAPVVKNAARARIRGFELESEMLILPGLRLSGGVGHLGARYTAIDRRASEITLGKKLVHTPEWTANVALSYDAIIAGLGSLKPRIDWSFTSTVYNDALNSPEISQPGYNLINASLGFIPSDSDFSLMLGVRNLANKHYLVSGNVNPSLGAASATYARPREAYVRARITF
ncbi:TonB-dependent receptor [Sphingobium sp. CR28]|uniref:TonB-dependent receptor n=1 Tax=Sphingobium sp. CR28 TaxID=3400272 RepID=UPI003FEE1157